MGLEIVSQHLNGIIVFKPKVSSDDRGFFMETFRADEFERWGLTTHFVQDNHSRSVKGALRGMHFQWDPPQGKLIRVTQGRAFVAEVDIRPGSPTLGKWWGAEISAENKFIVWAPPGFANGFAALSDIVDMQYKVTAYWNAHGESGILWNDDNVGIKWPFEAPFLSEKDKAAQTLAEWLLRPEAQNFAFDKVKQAGGPKFSI